MYLSSRSGVIKYDRSMKEIQNFYNSLKTNSKLRHKNGSDVTLQLKFGNRVDFVGKKATSYVLGGVSLSHLFTAGRSINGAEPGMIISESNWCYRTAIMRNETEFVTKNVLIIKEADIQLNRDQFERNGLEYYVCLELFQAGIEERKSLSKKSPTITNGSTGTADTEDETPWYSNQITVIAIFGLVLLTFTFCKIKAKKFKTKLRFFQGAEKADDINKRESFELHHLDTPM